MAYDLKIYNEIISKAIEPSNTQILRGVPFLVAKDGLEYIHSKLKVCSIKNGHPQPQGTFDFSFSYGDLQIYESQVYHLEFFVKKQDNKYERIHIDTGVILSAEDLKDFVIVLYKRRNSDESIYLSCDLSIYDNRAKICELENVTSLRNIKKVDKNKILYYRRSIEENGWRSYNERWVYMNGQEHSESALNLTLSEWNDLFCPHNNSFWDLRHIFSLDNNISFFSKELMWNSEMQIKWDCPLGHSWKVPVKDLTAGTAFRNYCPVCQEFVPHFAVTSDEPQAERIFNKIQDARRIFNEENIEKVVTLLEEEIAEFQEMRKMGILWFDHSKMPDTISYSFVYPNGKHGDIDKTICDTYGEVTQLSEFLFCGLIPTNYFEEIELLSESYANDKLLNGIANDELAVFLPKHNVMHRLYYLSSLAHCLKMPTGRYSSIDREMTKYRSCLREKRTEIYNRIVGENKATHKWTSEQLLYHIVKSIFDDAIFQYKANWLGNQSLDIYIPSKNIAIEYQGIQHYQPVELFGGEAQFAERQKLDKRKKLLCHENNVILIEWKYIEEITDESVKAKLKKWL